MPETSRLEFLEKLLANKFVSSDGEDNTSGPLNKGSIADLPFLRTLLGSHQKSQDTSLWKVIDSFVLLSYTSLVGSRLLLQQILAYLNFTLDLKNSFWLYKLKNDCYELWHQHKQLKIMEVSETWPDIYDKGYLHQFQFEPTHRIYLQQRAAFRNILS